MVEPRRAKGFVAVTIQPQDSARLSHIKKWGAWGVFCFCREDRARTMPVTDVVRDF